MFQGMPVFFEYRPKSSPSTMSINNRSCIMQTTEQNPRKIRASCDVCSRSKVKCDKLRPTCHRCRNMGLSCNYSPSMRLGRPRKNRNPDGSLQRHSSPASSLSSLGPNPHIGPRTTPFTTESSPEPLAAFFIPTTPEYTFQDTIIAGFEDSFLPKSNPVSSTRVFFADDTYLNISDPLFTNPTPNFSTPYNRQDDFQALLGHPNSVGSFEALEYVPGSLATPKSCLVESKDDLQFCRSWEIANPLATSELCSLPILNTPLSGSPHSQNHDCTEFAFSTLSSLYSLPSFSPTLSDFGGSGSLPTLDAVLSMNKAAIEKASILLSCPCSTNPHYSTTITFIIVQILAWYQAVAGMNSVASSTWSTLVQMEEFTCTPMMLRAFTLEEQRSRVQLVLGELRKVAKLVDKFSERYCRKADASEQMDGGVYGAFEALLRTRVRDTLKMALKHTPEEVRRQLVHKK